MRRIGYSIRGFGLSIFVGVLLCFSDTSMATICRFQGLGDLPGGNYYSKANGVSADGSVVVGESHSALGWEGFRWENGVVTGLGDLPGGYSWSKAYGLSANGSIVVGQSVSASGGEAFRWENGSMTGIGELPGSPYFSSKAYAASGDGSVIVGESYSTTNMEAFRWTKAEGMVSLGGGGGSVAYGVSADGSVIVGTCRSTKTSDDEAFRWTQAEGIVGLGFLVPPDPMNALSGATAVSADGSVIVGWSAPSFPSSALEPFRWENGVMKGLGAPGVARAVSADGAVVVGDDDNAQGTKAFIWDSNHGVRYLKDVLMNDCGLALTGWTLQRATGISGDGLTIVGYGTNPGGLTEGWIATIPEPATLSLLALGAAGLLKKRRA